MKSKSKQNILLAVAAILPSVGFAADAAAASANTVSYTVLGLGIAAIIGAIWAILNLFNSIMQVEKIKLLKQYSPEKLEEAGVHVVKKSWLEILYEKATKAVPVEKEEDVMLDHDYDGIHELDNSLPPWWLALFYFTIALAPVYLWFNHWSEDSVSSAQAYEIEVEEAEEKVSQYLATKADLVDEENVVALTSAGDLNVGSSIYNANCVACHGAAGEGGVGPNLTDDYWIHGGGIKNVFKVVTYGVPEKGMISWKTQLRASDIQKVASYILTMQGTNPPNGKAPQGEKWIPQEEAETPSDS